MSKERGEDEGRRAAVRPEARSARLAAALRANLHRRKEQARAREETPAPGDAGPAPEET